MEVLANGRGWKPAPAAPAFEQMEVFAQTLAAVENSSVLQVVAMSFSPAEACMDYTAPHEHELRNEDPRCLLLETFLALLVANVQAIHPVLPFHINMRPLQR